MATDTLRTTHSGIRLADRAQDPATRTLVRAGAISGPLFVVTAGAQALTREGFDLTRHPISLLSLGEAGWVQIANFIVAGLLSLAFAAGVARSLRDGPGRRWAPGLLAVYGIGLIVGGVFTADPALGFPPGAPEGVPAALSNHGLVHAFAPPIAFTALVAACVVLARRFAWQGLRLGAVLTSVTAIVCFVLTVPFGPWLSVRLFVAVALGFAWITAYAIHLLRTGTPAEALDKASR